MWNEVKMLPKQYHGFAMYVMYVYFAIVQIGLKGNLTEFFRFIDKETEENRGKDIRIIVG